MTGTSVKDVGLTLGSMAASRNVSAKDLFRNGFRKVWDNQSGRENFCAIASAPLFCFHDTLFFQISLMGKFHVMI